MTSIISSHAHVTADKESGNIFSSFSAGLTAGVNLLLEKGFEAQWLMTITNRHLSGAFW